MGAGIRDCRCGIRKSALCFEALRFKPVLSLVEAGRIWVRMALLPTNPRSRVPNPACEGAN